MKRLAAIGVVVTLLLGVVGCGGAARMPTRPPRPDYLEAGFDELVERANAWTAGSLRARGQLFLGWIGRTEERHVDARLLATRAGGIRLQGTRPLLPTLFLLVSDGAEMSLRVPSRETVYVGSATAPSRVDPERPYLSLRPAHITEPLLPQPLPTRTDGGDQRVLLETFPSTYVLSWMESTAATALRLRRRVWIERLGLKVSRIQTFDAEGRVRLDARYGDYPGPSPTAYPRDVRVELPWEQLRFRFVLEEVTPDPELSRRVFVLEAAPGDRTVPIEEAFSEGEEDEATEPSRSGGSRAPAEPATPGPSASSSGPLRGLPLA